MLWAQILKFTILSIKECGYIILLGLINEVNIPVSHAACFINRKLSVLYNKGERNFYGKIFYENHFFRDVPEEEDEDDDSN